METHTIDKAISDSTIVALLLTGTAFLSTYFMQVGYCAYFNISKALIRITGNTIAEWFERIGILFLLFALFEVLIAKLFYSLFVKYPENVFVEQYYKYSFFVFCSLVLFIQVVFNTGLLLCLSFAGVLTIIILSFIITHIRYKKGVLTLKQIEKEESNDDTKLSVIRILLGKKLLPMLFLTFILISFSNNAGKEIAREQHIFFQIDGRTDLVGIQVYNDYVVLKKTMDEKLSSTEIIGLSGVSSIEMIENPAFSEMVKSYNSKKVNSKETTN